MKANPNKSRARYVLTKKQMDEVKLEIVQKTMLLAAITYADQNLIDEEKQEYYPDAPERIMDFWERITRYAGGVDKKLISMHFVTKVLREHVGLDVHW